MSKGLVASVIIVVILIAAGFGGWWYFNTEEEVSDVEDNSNDDAIEEMVANIVPEPVNSVPNQKEANSEVRYKDISPEKAHELVNSGNELTVIDVSPKYAEGHLVGSINYYVGDGSLDKVISKLDKNDEYLVYCHVDSASILGAQKLTEAGFKNVYRLKGNYAAWTAKGYPVITDLAVSDSARQGELKAVDGSNSSGQGYVLGKDNSLDHLVVATLPDPGAGKFYEGWLVDQEPTTKFFSTGMMFKTPEGKWRLEYIADQAYLEYDYAVITLETSDDGKPEGHVIEGRVQ